MVRLIKIFPAFGNGGVSSERNEVNVIVKHWSWRPHIFQQLNSVLFCSHSLLFLSHTHTHTTTLSPLHVSYSHNIMFSSYWLLRFCFLLTFFSSSLCHSSTSSSLSQLTSGAISPTPLSYIFFTLSAIHYANQAFTGRFFFFF